MANERIRLSMLLPSSLAETLDREVERIGCTKTELVVHILLNYFEQRSVMQLADIASEVSNKPKS